jgi:predicted aspartyl protease
MKFSYRRYRVQTASEQIQIVYRPVVPITIHGPKASIELFGLVDTGADFTMLPWKLVDLLGVTPDHSRSADVTGFGDPTVTAVPAEVELELGRGRTIYRWSSETYFGDQEYLLLGNEGFLKFFIATFDGGDQTLELLPSRYFTSASSAV